MKFSKQAKPKPLAEVPSAWLKRAEEASNEQQRGDLKILARRTHTLLSLLGEWLDTGTQPAAFERALQLVGEAGAASIKAKASRSPVPAPASPAATVGFEASVLHAARKTRLVDDASKAWISHTWRQWWKDGGQLSPEPFKAALVDAAKKGTIRLSRADLVEAFDPRDVAESRTLRLGTELHFIRLDEPPAPLLEDLPAFAKTVQELALRAQEGTWLGKVFISQAWKDFVRTRGQVSLESFKAALVNAQRAGKLSLGRADLIGVLPPAFVAASETKDGRHTYHFIETEHLR